MQKWVIIAILILFIPSVLGASVTRSISNAEPSIEGEIIITLDVIAEGPYTIEEWISGLDVIDNGGGLEDMDMLSFEGENSGTHSYKLKAMESGEFGIEGILMSDLDIIDVEGDSSISVNEVAVSAQCFEHPHLIRGNVDATNSAELIDVPVRIYLLKDPDNVIETNVVYDIVLGYYYAIDATEFGTQWCYDDEVFVEVKANNGAKQSETIKISMSAVDIVPNINFEFAEVNETEMNQSIANVKEALIEERTEEMIEEANTEEEVIEEEIEEKPDFAEGTVIYEGYKDVEPMQAEDPNPAADAGAVQEPANENTANAPEAEPSMERVTGAVVKESQPNNSKTNVLLILVLIIAGVYGFNFYLHKKGNKPAKKDEIESFIKDNLKE